MAAFTGEISHTVGDKTYRLCLGLGGVARLQEEYGKDLAPFDVKPKETPDFAPLLRIIELALERYHPEADKYDAEDILRSDMAIWNRILVAAFPNAPKQAENGQDRAPEKRKARR